MNLSDETNGENIDGDDLEQQHRQNVEIREQCERQHKLMLDQREGMKVKHEKRERNSDPTLR
jgi:hypothetical protein